ncbi:toutatis-like protein [Sarcoptes scabiei]|uniref:Toutatis-like protein n=1 Tax=Sarcoptes scabiei TaxID=52283 RepID=A0A132AKP8_SARSC|nr:toutatis-like protein [Sarcoptes scabiei]
MNLSTKTSKISSSSFDEDVSAPLNLCVKKNDSNNHVATVSKSDNHGKERSRQHQNNKSDSQTSNFIRNLANNLSNPPIVANIPPPQKKRGRKPKSMLNNLGDNQMISLPEFQANYLAASLQQQQQQQPPPQPRKRGRPPTLSPQHNNPNLVKQLTSSLANQQIASAFPNTYPFNYLNNPNAANEVLNRWPGLNALFAAAAAVTGNPLLNNSNALSQNNQNPLQFLQKINQKDLNPMNANLLNLKSLAAALEQQSSIISNSNDFMNKLAKLDPVNFFQLQQQQQFLNHHKDESNLMKAQTFLPPGIAPPNIDLAALNSSNSLNNKNSFAHKPNPSEKLIRIPLNHGFKRLTYITGFSKQASIEGDVIYVAPCGKRLKNSQDLIKYLTKKDISNLTKDNFSFDPNIIVGQFIQNIVQLGTEVVLSESQLKLQLEEISKIRNLDLTVQPSASNSMSNNHVPEKKKRVRDSGGTRNVYDSIRNQKVYRTSSNECEPSVTITIQNAAPIRGVKRKSIEKRDVKQQKALKKQQEERRKKELKEKAEREERKLREAQERQLEIQKQEELKISAEIEHERVSQHQMFIHALNELKTSEDREQKKEELAQEKLALHERQQVKKALEFELVKVLKKPIEDMMLKDHKILPRFNRIPGLKLTGKAFGDMMMVHEFLHNFGETIGLDVNDLPSLNSLMMALLNLNRKSEDELIKIVNHLVVCAIEDPGIPNNVSTMMGQKLKDAAITDHNVTEILKLYFFSFFKSIREEDEPNRIECKLYEQLGAGIPFIAMNAIAKLDVLVFLCNELLCNQAIVKQIDESIESVSVFKKDRWGIENEIRKLRLVKVRREQLIKEEAIRLQLQQQQEKKENISASVSLAQINSSANNDVSSESTENIAGEVSDNEENTTSTTLNMNSVISSNTTLEFDDDVNLTNDEIEKKIEKLNKQCNQMNNKMLKAYNSYRVFPLGQDRYRRNYWVIPNCGGVFVEGIESGEPEEMINNVWTEEEIEMENVMKIKPDEDIKTEYEFLPDATEEILEEKLENDEDSKADIFTESDVMKSSSEENEKNVLVEETDDDKEKIKKDPNDETLNEPTKELSANAKTEDETDEKKEIEQSETSENIVQSDEISVDEVVWFDLDLEFHCDEFTGKIVGQNDLSKNMDDEDLESVADQEDKEILNEHEKSLSTFLNPETIDCLFKFADQNIEDNIFKHCLLRIVSAYPKSSSITKFPNSDVTEIDITVCPNLQKRILLWKILQYDKPHKIPREFQLGWWRITDSSQLKSMIELFHSNALRESNLQKYMIKHLNYATQSCKNTSSSFDVNDYDREASDAREFGAPTENRCEHRQCQTKGFCLEVAIRKDFEVLELIEAFSEKISSCSMQIRNWKSTNKISCKDLKSKMFKIRSKDRNKKSSSKNFMCETNDSAFDFVYEDGQLLIKDDDDDIEYNLLRIQKDKLLEIEPTIERKYLKPPLGFKNNQTFVIVSNSENGNTDDYQDNITDENASTGLLRWRDATREAKCSSQIAMALKFLESCVAWEKSIVRTNKFNRITCLIALMK